MIVEPNRPRLQRLRWVGQNLQDPNPVAAL